MYLYKYFHHIFLSQNQVCLWKKVQDNRQTPQVEMSNPKSLDNESTVADDMDMNKMEMEEVGRYV